MAADTTRPAAGVLRRLWAWLPEHVDRRVIVAAWICEGVS